MERKVIRNKNFAGIDYFRLIAAFMVIAIHVSPFSNIDRNLDFIITYCMGRIAVPFFLMVTGYFVLAPYVISDFCNKIPVLKYIKKNLFLYITATVGYLPISIYSGNVPQTATELIKWLFFDGTFYHLWYFPAAIIGCIIIMLLVKKSVSATFGFCVIAYMIGLFGDSYYGIIKGIPLFNSLYKGIFQFSSYTRNGIFFAPMFIALGMLIAILPIRYERKQIIQRLIICFVLMIFEGVITYYFNLQKHNSMYLFLIPVVYFLFQLLLTIFQKAPSWIRDISMFIYIIHPAVIILLRGIAKITHLEKLFIENTFIQYCLVCVWSMAIAFIIKNIRKGKNRNVRKRTSMD